MILYNAIVHTMTKPPFQGAVEVSKGKISAVFSAGERLSLTESDLDCKGLHLYPGLIDIHTHLGMIEDGLGFEGDDCNEENDPLTPHLRAVDAVNPLDDCFGEALDAGITTVVTGPGSANPISGELIAVKTWGRRADDMVIRTVGMKFALGENPKSTYHDKNQSPGTRMATAALIREALYKAQKYAKAMEDAKLDDELEEPEYDIKSEALLPLLRREVKAHFHCHRADDMFTALRIAKEFQLDPVLVHATEGHLIADMLGEEKVPAIVGPVICDRSKPEMKQLSVHNAAKLYESGVTLAFCTDHPVIPVQYLAASAAVAVKGGLPFEEAMKAITLSAAEIAGIDDRVGSIEEGKDADLVLVKGNPLELLSEVCLVLSDGRVVKNHLEEIE